MGPWGVLSFVLRLLVLLVLSHFIDLMLARSMSRGGYRAVRWFGVAVHEMSHATACWLTGTKVMEINLFDQGGGYVRHEKRGPMLTVIIAMAPIFGGPLAVVGLAILFGMLGVYYPLHTSVPGSLTEAFTFIGTGLWAIFANNIGTLNPVTIILFILLLILVCSVVATLAPSSADFANGALGLVILALVLGLVVYFTPMAYVPGVVEFFNTPTPALDFAVTWMSAGLDIALLACFVILIILVPVYVLKGR